MLKNTEIDSIITKADNRAECPFKAVCRAQDRATREEIAEWLEVEACSYGKYEVAVNALNVAAASIRKGLVG